jgi:hypothetical protein
MNASKYPPVKPELSVRRDRSLLSARRPLRTPGAQPRPRSRDPPKQQNQQVLQPLRVPHSGSCCRLESFPPCPILISSQPKINWSSAPDRATPGAPFRLVLPGWGRCICSCFRLSSSTRSGGICRAPQNRPEPALSEAGSRPSRMGWPMWDSANPHPTKNSGAPSLPPHALRRDRVGMNP